MRGLKLLFNSWYKMKFLFWAMLVLAALIGTMPFFEHEALGNDDYLFPKMFIFFPMILLAEIGLICGCRDICANRLMRSVPIAKELYTRSVPIFITVMVVGISAVMLTAYFIFIGVIGAELAQFSDTLVCGAIFCLPILILSPLAARVPAGGVIIVYALFLPAAAVVLIGGDKVQSGGFGLPLWAAAAIFGGSLIVGTGFAFWISAVRYKKSNVKIIQTMMPVK